MVVMDEFHLPGDSVGRGRCRPGAADPAGGGDERGCWATRRVSSAWKNAPGATSPIDDAERPVPSSSYVNRLPDTVERLLASRWPVYIKNFSQMRREGYRAAGSGAISANEPRLRCA